MSEAYIQSSKPFLAKYSICFVHRLCTNAENNAEKLKNSEYLIYNLSKYHYPEFLIKQGNEKAYSTLK